jgi:hypothetical protein
MSGTGVSSIISYNLFLDTTIAGAGTYAENAHEFIDDDSGTPFQSHTIQIANDGASDLFFRFIEGAGPPDHGRVKSGEVLTQDFRRERRIFFKGTPGLAFRFWAY